MQVESFSAGDEDPEEYYSSYEEEKEEQARATDTALKITVEDPTQKFD